MLRKRVATGLRTLTIWAAILGFAPFVALLAVRDLSAFAVALIVMAPVILLVHRTPVVVIPIWLGIAPLVVEGNGGAERQAFTALHRGLPLVALILIAFSGWFGLSHRRRTSFNIVDWLVIGYALATILSALVVSLTPDASLVHVYDRVLAPILLYFVVRTGGPTAEQLERWSPVLLVTLGLQCAIGALAWVAPGLVPGAWLGRAGQRTIGSLGHPNVFGVAVLFFGLFLLHAATTSTRSSRVQRLLYSNAFLVSLFAAFFTFGRANWLAAIAATAIAVIAYPRKSAQSALVGLTIVGVLVVSGALDEQIETAQNRFLSEQSEESALSRLPVVIASLRMIEEKPIAGWGYGNFDEFDRQFQGSIEGLVIPEKDHASHNLYLTIAAEQGLTGLFLYLAPALFTLVFALRSIHLFPSTGFVSKRLLLILGGSLATHLIVNNFANMRNVYGLGLWWICLGLVVHLVDFARYANRVVQSTVDVVGIDPQRLDQTAFAGRP